MPRPDRGTRERLGGATALPESQMRLVRRASAIECELEQMEGRLSCAGALTCVVCTRGLRSQNSSHGFDNRSLKLLPRYRSSMTNVLDLLLRMAAPVSSWSELSVGLALDCSFCYTGLVTSSLK
jgi:hypothetical protein